MRDDEAAADLEPLRQQRCKWCYRVISIEGNAVTQHEASVYCLARRHHYYDRMPWSAAESLAKREFEENQRSGKGYAELLKYYPEYHVGLSMEANGWRDVASVEAQAAMLVASSAVVATLLSPAAFGLGVLVSSMLMRLTPFGSFDNPTDSRQIRCAVDVLEADCPNGVWFRPQCEPYDLCAQSISLLAQAGPSRPECMVLLRTGEVTSLRPFEVLPNSSSQLATQRGSCPCARCGVNADAAYNGFVGGMRRAPNDSAFLNVATPNPRPRQRRMLNPNQSSPFVVSSSSNDHSQAALRTPVPFRAAVPASWAQMPSVTANPMPDVDLANAPTQPGDPSTAHAQTARVQSSPPGDPSLARASTARCRLHVIGAPTAAARQPNDPEAIREWMIRHVSRIEGNTLESREDLGREDLGERRVHSPAVLCSLTVVRQFTLQPASEVAYWVDKMAAAPSAEAWRNPLDDAVRAKLRSLGVPVENWPQTSDVPAAGAAAAVRQDPASATPLFRGAGVKASESGRLRHVVNDAYSALKLPPRTGRSGRFSMLFSPILSARAVPKLKGAGKRGREDERDLRQVGRKAPSRSQKSPAKSDRKPAALPVHKKPAARAATEFQVFCEVAALRAPNDLEAQKLLNDSLAASGVKIHGQNLQVKASRRYNKRAGVWFQLRCFTCNPKTCTWSGRAQYDSARKALQGKEIVGDYMARYRKSLREDDVRVSKRPNNSYFHDLVDHLNASIGGPTELQLGDRRLRLDDGQLRALHVRVDGDELSIPMVCPALIAAVLRMVPQPWYLKLSMDGTYRLLVFRNYVLLNVGCNVKTFAPAGAQKLDGYSSTYVPLGFALAHVESGPSYTKLLEAVLHVAGMVRGEDGFPGAVDKHLPAEHAWRKTVMRLFHSSRFAPKYVFHLAWSSLFGELSEDVRGRSLLSATQHEYFHQQDDLWSAYWRAGPDRVAPGTATGSAAQEEWPAVGQRLDLCVLNSEGEMRAQGRTCATSLLAWGLHHSHQDEAGNAHYLIPASRLRNATVDETDYPQDRRRPVYVDRPVRPVPPEATACMARAALARTVADAESALAQLGVYSPEMHTITNWKKPRAAGATAALVPGPSLPREAAPNVKPAADAQAKNEPDSGNQEAEPSIEQLFGEAQRLQWLKLLAAAGRSEEDEDFEVRLRTDPLPGGVDVSASDDFMVCWDFVRTGNCPRGSSCRWNHPSK
ncbi:unnamed protein product [Effrenium voratum]|nr:unnamed protein product [Effrenium voratum]